MPRSFKRVFNYKCFNPRTHEGYDHDFFTNEKLPFNSFNPRTHEGYDHCIAHLVLIPSRYLAKADCRAKPGGAYFLSVGDTVFSPPTTDARLTIQFIPLPTFHLDGRRILVFLIKLPSFLKQIFHIYHFLEERYFYKKKITCWKIGRYFNPRTHEVYDYREGWYHR